MNLFRNRPGRLLLLWVAQLAVCGPAARAADGGAGKNAASQESSIYPLGMCSNGNVLTSAEYPAKMVDAGARMCRVDIAFQNIRPAPGDDPNHWNWTAMDQIRQMRAKHPTLDHLVLLGYGPAWAEDARFRPDKGYGDVVPFNCPQAGIDVMPVNDPKNLYGHYVYEMVNRYKDVVKHWESWNEPDLPGNHFFKGTGKDFVAYQKACYLAAKKADPQCTVLFAGLCYGTIEGYLATHGLKAPTPYPPQVCFFEEYLKECVKDPDAKANHFYFDLMNQHSYTRATDLYDYVMINNKLMQDYLGEMKPTWITEMGITDTGKPGFDGTPEQYCDYVLQAFGWAKLAHVQRLFHFQLDNSNGCGLYQGMLGDPKPVLGTYRDVLAKELADTDFVRQLHGHSGVGFLDGNSAYDHRWKTGYCLFEFRRHGDNARMMMAFADTDKPAEAQIPATKNKATVITRDNQRRVIDAQNGFYTVPLAGSTSVGGWPSYKDNPAATALGDPEQLVGGATVLLVEE